MARRDSEHDREKRKEVSQVQNSQFARDEAIRKQETNSQTNARGGTGARGSKTEK